MYDQNVANMVFTGGTALAGLLLVFLGVLFTSYESYNAEQKAFVRPKYRRRGIIVFIGFLAALIAASTVLLANWYYTDAFMLIGVVALALSFVFLVWTAAVSLRDFS